MSEQSLANLDYGYNWSTETWHVYQNEGAPVATVATEEIAVLFAAAPGQAAEIEHLKEQSVELIVAIENILAVCEVALLNPYIPIVCTSNIEKILAVCEVALQQIDFK